MKFEKWNKLGKGRPIGSKNAKTEQWLVFDGWFMEEAMGRLQEEMSKLEGKEYVHTVINLLEYFKPKLARNDSKVELEVKDINKLLDQIENGNRPKVEGQTVAHVEFV